MLERTSIKNTALYDMHVKLNAKLVEFAGYKMPISYDKIISEYKSVRTKCGIFDVSHMGQIKVTGTDATKFIQQISTNNIMKISAYEAQYSVLCNEEGGLIDDLIIFKFPKSLIKSSIK